MGSATTGICCSLRVIGLPVGSIRTASRPPVVCAVCFRALRSPVGHRPAMASWADISESVDAEFAPSSEFLSWVSGCNLPYVGPGCFAAVPHAGGC